MVIQAIHSKYQNFKISKLNCEVFEDKCSTTYGGLHLLATAEY